MERVWPSRLRWRLRGASQWPAFALLVVVDAILLHVLPIDGDGTGPVGALLLSAFFNLLVVAVAAPLAGRLVRGRRPDLPPVVAADGAGTALLALLALALALAGLAHRGAIRAGRAEVAAAVTRVRAYVGQSAPAAYRHHLDEATSLRFGGGLYRTCVPRADRRRWLCLFVDTTQHPPGLRRDTSSAPNATYLTGRQTGG